MHATAWQVSVLAPTASARLRRVDRLVAVDDIRASHVNPERSEAMHAVVTRVTINDDGASESELREKVVPGVSHAPGFVAGYWTRKDNSGLSMIIFESEEAANTVRDQMPNTVPGSVSLESTEVREVVANA
jgi:hypothetical protein